MKRDQAETNGEIVDPVEIDARAATGDVACEATLRRYEIRLARALAEIINILVIQRGCANHG